MAHGVCPIHHPSHDINTLIYTDDGTAFWSWLISRVHTDIKMLFLGLSRTSKDQIPGFTRTLKSFFHDFPGHCPFTNMSCMRSKSAYTQSVISVSALKQRRGNAIPEIVLLYLTV